MEAKVDIRKLQLLNDRIAQVTDALNQVRLSVHGLSHTGVIGQPFSGVPFGIPQPQYAPFGIPPQTPYTWSQPMGFQHTSLYPGLVGAGSFGQAPWQTGLQWPGSGLQFAGAYGPPGGYSPFGQGLSPFGVGLSHTPELMEQRVNDPNRILQTFPFCLAPQSAAAAW